MRYAISRTDSNEVLRFANGSDRKKFLTAHGRRWVGCTLNVVRNFWRRCALNDSSNWVEYIDKVTGVTFATFGYN